MKGSVSCQQYIVIEKTFTIYLLLQAKRNGGSSLPNYCLGTHSLSAWLLLTLLKLQQVIYQRLQLQLEDALQPCELTASYSCTGVIMKARQISNRVGLR